jgi:hypothetical protein
LIDRLGDIRSVLRERFGDEVAMPLVSAERGWFGRRVPGVASELAAWPGAGTEPGASLVGDLVSAIEARAMWGRYGL